MEWRADGVLPPANPDGFPVNDANLLVAIQDVLGEWLQKLTPRGASLIHR